MNRLHHVFLADLTPQERRSLVRRSAVPDRGIRAEVDTIVEEIIHRGDAAIAEYSERYGGGSRRIDGAEIASAAMAMSPQVTEALHRSAEAIRTYHSDQIPRDRTISTTEGVDITRSWTPLRRVGAYVPGGKAAYPSTVLMTVVPAIVAGVSEIVVVSPAGPDGTVSPTTLAACSIAGATEVWAMGGAQAIAALACGTETVRPVQKIVGPGNSWVTAAKLAVLGICGIDLPAGPSEVLVLADHTAEPTLVAADLLCQAEHGPDSPAVLVTTDPSLPPRVEAELERLMGELDRVEILDEALRNHGLAIVATDHSAAIRFADEYAAEHVTIMTADPDADAKQITAAGSVYVGRNSPESAGDYATGANHVLPTGGLAGAYGPLSVDDFGSWRQEQRITAEGLTRIVDVITTLADAEGLTAHRLAAELRTRPGEDQ